MQKLFNQRVKTIITSVNLLWKNFNLLDFVISTLYNKKPEVQRNDVLA